MAYVVTIGEKKFNIEIEIDKENCYILLNGQKLSANISKITENHFSIIINNRSFDILLMDNSTISVNGEIFNVLVEDERKGLTKEKEKKGPLIIKADMPGLIVEVNVNEGDNISVDTPLLIIEAMKMQNEIKAQMKGIVRKVKVKKGDIVNQGDELIVVDSSE